MRRVLIASLLAFATALPTAHALLFVDTVNHPHETQIDTLAGKGIVQGYGYGIFRPDQPINRAEFLKILMLAVFGSESLEVYNDRCFSDFTGERQWFWPYACKAKERGIIGGYPDGTFRGTQTVNLAEALKMTVQSWNIPVTPGEYAPEYWYIPFFEVGAARGLFQYFPRSGAYQLTRSDMAYLIVEMGEPIQVVAPPQSSASSSLAAQCGNGALEAGEQCDDANQLDGDGCSSICVLVDEPVYHAALRIEQRSVGIHTVTPGAKNVTLLAFDAIAGRQDAAITHLSFRAKTGNLEAATNYRIFADVNADGIAEQLMGQANADDGRVTFDALSIAVSDGGTVRVELVADFSQSIQSGQFGVEFALSDGRFIQAIGLVDNRDLSGIEVDGAACTENSICWIAVHTVSADPFTIRGRGNLFVTVDPSPVRSHQLVGGSTSPDLLRLRFRAEGEDIEVTGLRITADEGVFTQLLLVKDGSSSATSTLWVSECAPVVPNQFCADTSVLIPQDTEVTYSVRGVLKSDQQGITSGDTVTVLLEADPAIRTVEAVGKESQEDLTFNNGDTSLDGEVFIGRSVPGPDQDIVGSTHDIVLAKIIAIENANPDHDQTSVPTGTRAFGIFRFTAAEHENIQDGRNPVTVSTISFLVNATNVEFLADSFKLYNVDDASMLHDCAASGVTGQITVTCAGLDSSDVNTQISSGDSIELALRGFITNPQLQAGNSVLQASIQSLGSRNNGGTVEWDDGITAFDWVDIDQTAVQSTTYVK